MGLSEAVRNGRAVDCWIAEVQERGLRYRLAYPTGWFSVDMLLLHGL